MSDEDLNDKTVHMPRDRQAGDGDTRLHDVLPTVLQNQANDPTTVIHARAAGGQAADTIGQRGPLNPQGEVGVGSVINNRFVIEQLLGRGGMGVVYRALDRRRQEADDREPHVAIKILSEDFKRHPKAFIALQREASKSQSLAHPNIVTVFDFDRDDDVVFMTMEELCGMPLRDLIKANPRGIPRDKATAIILQMARGLAHAHAEGIVHADLKPGNVFLTDKNTVKILDFGIARAVAEVDASLSEGTQFDAGELGGLTPGYASCEMFENQNPHPSDDVYALGLIAYELFSGRHPFDRQPANIAAQSQRVPERIKGIPQRQWQVVKASLAFERADRIQDARQFVKRFGGKSRTPLIAASIMLSAIVVGATIVLRPVERVGPEIPFEKLPEDIQKQVQVAIENGREAISYADFNGALFYFNTAYELHPRNQAASEGLQTVVQQVLSELRSDKPSRDNSEKLMQLNALLEYPALAKNIELLEARTALQARE